MWSYYGAKTNIAHLYPKPKHAKIIEPFAGTARYALRHFEHDVLLIDKYDVIINIWKWLQQCSEKDITGLPRIKAGENINDFNFDCEEARMLMGFCIGYGFYSPRHLATVRLRDRPKTQDYKLNRIAKNLFKIRHWKIELGDYSEIVNQAATWFIDPPYQIGGHAYPHSNKKINYDHLSEWCKSRNGQVIVCESEQANWLPFIPMTVQNTYRGKYRESIWSNEPTQFNNIQLSLL